LREKSKVFECVELRSGDSGSAGGEKGNPGKICRIM